MWRWKCSGGNPDNVVIVPIVGQGGSMTTIVLKESQKVLVTLRPTTDEGKPAVVDGAPSWVVKSGDVTMSVAADGLSATLFAGTVHGDSVIVITADSDLGTGVVTLTESITVTVDGDRAHNLGIFVGVPTTK